MRRHFLTKYLWAVLLVGFTPWQSVYGVAWAGVVTADVVDDDVQVVGDVLLGDAANDNIEVFAATQDIEFTIVGAARTITANDSAPNGGEKGLNFRANAGRTITMEIDFDVDFIADNENFVVSFSGAGNLRIRLADGTTFSISGNSINSTGTYFLVNMDTTANTPNVEDVCFFRQNAASNSDVFIDVDADSVLGFMATDTTLATQTAVIGFDASNNVANSGRMRLNVLDGGAVAIQSYDTEETITPVASDIDFETLAGNRGIFRIKTVGGGAWSGFLVVNSNTELANFRSNPWCADDPLDGNDELIVGIQPGFVLGKNGQLDVAQNTYFDYVGNSVNITPDPSIPEEILEKHKKNGILPKTSMLIKERNPSAFFVDGPTFCSDLPRPIITMDAPAKIYFRSAVDCDGPTADPNFLVDPKRQFTERLGYGSIVFDVEGTLDVFGDAFNINTAINILSLREANVGGSVLIEGSETIFKLRPDPHATDGNGDLEQYGKAAFLINGRMNLTDTALQHTDEIHKVFIKNTPQESEPAYIGGERFFLCCEGPRPCIAYYDADLLLHSSAAFTGVDHCVPSMGVGVESEDNDSDFVFYHNGYCIDQGTGRSLNLGTNIGAVAADLCSLIDNSSHFDIYEEFDQDEQDIVAQILTRPNNNKVTEGLTGDITNEFSVHSFFLAHGTNVSIGTNGAMGTDPCTQAAFALESHPTLFVNGDFISFESQGGILNKPETSVATGQGGIFVDNQGIFELANNRRMSLATMVGVGFNGVVDLKSRQTFFDSRIGITRSNLDLSVVAQQTIVPADANIPDFTLDWKFTKRDTCDGGFVPYIPPNTPPACQCAAPTQQNVSNLPTVRGKVDQFQVRNSRLGDPAHLKVDDGKIRELVFLRGDGAGVAPVGVVVMTNDAEVGLGTAQRNIDSVDASVVLGINGVTLMPDGNAQVFLNEDVIINNVCHIIPGPNFGIGVAQTLSITSPVPREIRIKSDGVLDMSLFNTANKRVEIGGQVAVIAEPGSRIIMGGGEFIITDNASIQLEQFVDAAYVGTTIASSDIFRVRFTGSGILRVEEDAFVSIPRGSCAGIESGGIVSVPDNIGQDQSAVVEVDCPVVTNLTWIFEDAGQLRIGTPTDYGGCLQVGNTSDVDGGSVAFNLIVDGISSRADINSQGMLGLGAGIINKPNEEANEWLIGPLFNVDSITITLTEGVFQHNQIFTGGDINAGLLAIGNISTAPGNGYTFTFDPVNSRILGGGNMVHTIANGPPTVLTTDSATVGIFSSKPLLEDSSITVPAFPATGAALFSYLKVTPYATQDTKRATLFDQANLGTATVGYVNGATIVREGITAVRSNDGTYIDPARSAEIGAVGIALDDTGSLTVYASRS